MCVVHNALLRGLNSIYIQGPNIQPADYTDFIGYSLCWHSVVHEHHTSEEDLFFPGIEEAVGEKGLLDGNVEEHSKQDDLKYISVLIDIPYIHPNPLYMQTAKTLTILVLSYTFRTTYN